MSSRTKTQKEESIDLKIDKVLGELSSKARKLTNKFNNSLIDLEMIIEEIENERLEGEKTKGMIKKLLEEFKTEKTEELESKLKFLTIKCRFFKD